MFTPKKFSNDNEAILNFLNNGGKIKKLPTNAKTTQPKIKEGFTDLLNLTK